jgi:hypothetical protein
MQRLVRRADWDVDRVRDDAWDCVIDQVENVGLRRLACGHCLRKQSLVAGSRSRSPPRMQR